MLHNIYVGNKNHNIRPTLVAKATAIKRLMRTTKMTAPTTDPATTATWVKVTGWSVIKVPVI